jgi:hypothetical protein
VKIQNEGAPMTLEEYYNLYSGTMEEGISLKQIKQTDKGV